MKNARQRNTLPIARPSRNSADIDPLPGRGSSSTNALLSSKCRPGAIFRRTEITSALLPRTKIRNLIDSGSAKTTMGTRHSGRIPPKMNTDFQPKFEISGTLINPPRTAPSENPHHAIATDVARFRAGAYSEASAITLGIAPPSPMPQRNRRRVKDSIEAA